MLHVNNLSFRYGKREILKTIRFSANPSDLLCVLGPNGVGKTTLFRCILGLNKGYKGSITIDNENIKNMKPVELAKKIAYIPQSHQPTFNFKVLDVVMMGLTPHLGKTTNPTKEHENAAYESLQQLGIAHLYNRGYGEISGGERQMTLIARAITQRAPILVMDEPTANLDYGNQLRVMEKVKELANNGYTIIMSTHNPEHAFMYGNKMIMLYDGEIIRSGNPKFQLTEDLIFDVYGVHVNLHDIYNGNTNVKVIVPTNINEKNSTPLYDERQYSAL